MKKTILAALALLVCVSAAAQLNVKKKQAATETIATVRSGAVKLVARDSVICAIFPSTNQFDDAGVFFLGKGAASAIETLDDMVALIAEGEIGSGVDVEQAGKTVRLRVDKQLGVRVLYLDFPGQAGLISTSKGELEKMKSALVKWGK